VKILDAQFVKSAVELRDCPPPNRPELAFAGRSNVGKSSMINALAARKKLVRVSGTPGRTRTLNFFDVSLATEGRPLPVRLVDLPGYGFAKVSKTERESFQKMISQYVGQRANLKVVVCIVDAEVGATPLDAQMLDLFSDSPARLLLAATKIDRLPKAKRKPKIAELAKQLELPREAVIPFSALEPSYAEEVWELLVSEL
jgi:GTP-binding protein